MATYIILSYFRSITKQIFGRSKVFFVKNSKNVDFSRFSGNTVYMVFFLKRKIVAKNLTSILFKISLEINKKTISIINDVQE